MNRTVWATWQQEGFHRWPSAPSHRDYLSVRHRHLFKFRAEVTVTQNDRQIEFHDLLDQCKRLYAGRTDFDRMSCEDIAEALVHHLTGLYPLSIVAVTCSEDGECGATLRTE